MSGKGALVLMLLALAYSPAPHLAQAQAVHHEGEDRIGVAAPAFNLQHWVNSAPLEISDLRGKVLLVRWWTDTCDLCAATAPALRKLQEEYGSRGFQVIGVFHPKPAGDWSVPRVEQAAARLGFTFPVALDGDWSALKRWWLDGAQRDYTSVSFIVDKHGVIRYVHPGGEFHESNGDARHAVCERDFKKIEAMVAKLTAEP
ncbi:MAG TPA: TlpA disulfide reductase family protein [Candidatus Angelobacter sp.]